MIEQFVARYGLFAVAFGAGAEGETAAIVGGMLAHQHFLTVPGAAIAAAAGSFLADQAFFLFGRHFRDNMRVKMMLDKPAAEKVINTLERHPIPFILGFRFLYGLRTISPVAVGTSDVSLPTFLGLNAIAASLWSLLFTTIGYFAGPPLLAAFGRSHPFHSIMFSIVAVIAGIAIVKGGWTLLRRSSSSG